MVNNLKDIISHSMAFIKDDNTELWVISTKVQEENTELSFDQLIEATKEVIQELVTKDGVLILGRDTQEPMNVDLKEIFKLVEDRFKTLGRMPNIGDGIWFTV